MPTVAPDAPSGRERSSPRFRERARLPRLRKNRFRVAQRFQCARENRLVFGEEIRHVKRYVTISAVQPGSSLSAAAQRERRVGRGPSEYVSAPRGGGVGPAGVRKCLQRRRRRVICGVVDAEGVALRLCAGDDKSRGLEQRIREDLGLRYLPGGQRPDNWALGALRRRQGAGAERRVYASGGDCTGVGAFGNGGPRFDAHSGLRFARWDRYRAAFAERAGEDTALEEMLRRQAIRRKARECGWRWRIWNGRWRTSRNA